MNINSKNIMNLINKNPPIKIEKKQKQKRNRKNSQIIINNNNNSKSNLDLKSNININNSKNINNLMTINNINNTNPIEKNSILEFNDYELNTMDYTEALKKDKRNFLQYYLSLLRTKHLLLFAIIPSNDYNSTVNKLCLFLFSFALYYTINGLFFTDSTIHEIYEEKGKYNFIYQLPQIIYSTIITSFVNMIIRFLSLSEKDVLKLKNEDNKDDLKTKKKKLTYSRILIILRIKFICFFYISLICLIFFWYYLSCFCAIYKNSQMHLLKDTLISFLLSLLYPFGFFSLAGLFRILSLKNKKKCIYKISKLIQ